ELPVVAQDLDGDRLVGMEAEQAGRPPDLVLCVLERLPLLLRDQPAERLRLRSQGVAHRPQRPPTQRFVPRPGARESLLCRGHSAIQLFAGRVGAIREGGTGGRIDDREAALPRDQLTGDQVVEGRHGASLPLGGGGRQEARREAASAVLLRGAGALDWESYVLRCDGSAYDFRTLKAE